MIALDTNILVRYITKDDDSQFQLAKELIKKSQGISKSIYINNIVICELIWVLKSGYKYTRNKIYNTVYLILNIEEFDVQNSGFILEAITLYETGSADFSDYLIYVINKSVGCVHTYSLDQIAISSGMFKQL